MFLICNGPVHLIGVKNCQSKGKGLGLYRDWKCLLDNKLKYKNWSNT